MLLVFYYVRDFFGFVFDLFKCVFSLLGQLITLLGSCASFLIGVIASLPAFLTIPAGALIAISIIYKILGREAQN